MEIVALYFATAFIFLALDGIALKKMMYPLFEKHVGPLMAEDINWGAAGVFYLFYIGGVIWFASMPAIASGTPATALISGFLIGLMAYGTYEFTNLATLKGWSWQMVITDVSWGATLTAISAWGGVVVVGALS